MVFGIQKLFKPICCCKKESQALEILPVIFLVKIRVAVRRLASVERTKKKTKHANISKSNYGYNDINEQNTREIVNVTSISNYDAT